MTAGKAARNLPMFWKRASIRCMSVQTFVTQRKFFLSSKIRCVW